MRFLFEAPRVNETEVALGMAADADQIKRMKARARQVGPEAKIGNNVQNQHFYSRNAKEAWQKLGKVEDYELNFEEFKGWLHVLV